MDNKNDVCQSIVSVIGTGSFLFLYFVFENAIPFLKGIKGSSLAHIIYLYMISDIKKEDNLESAPILDETNQTSPLQ